MISPRDVEARCPVQSSRLALVALTCVASLTSSSGTPVHAISQDRSWDLLRRDATEHDTFDAKARSHSMVPCQHANVGFSVHCAVSIQMSAANSTPIQQSTPMTVPTQAPTLVSSSTSALPSSTEATYAKPTTAATTTTFTTTSTNTSTVTVTVTSTLTQTSTRLARWMSVEVVVGKVAMNCSDAETFKTDPAVFEAMRKAVGALAKVSLASLKISMEMAPANETTTAAPNSGFGLLAIHTDDASTRTILGPQKDEQTSNVKQLIRSDVIMKSQGSADDRTHRFWPWRSTQGIVDVHFVSVPEGDDTAQAMRERMANQSTADVNVYVQVELTNAGLEQTVTCRVNRLSVWTEIRTGDELRGSKSLAAATLPGFLVSALWLMCWT